MKNPQTGTLQIIIQKQDGTKFTINAKESDTLQVIKEQIRQKDGARVFLQRLYLNQVLLEGNQTLKQLNITNGTVIKFQRAALKDIGVFDQHLGSIKRHILSTEDYKSSAEEVDELVKVMRANPNADFLLQEIDLDEKVLENILKFMDEKYKEKINSGAEKDDIQDLKINLAREQLVNITGEQLVQRLQNQFSESYNEIILRRCSAHGKLINFHTDVSLKTLQLSLNDDSDYEGGRLMYASKGQIHTPQRKKGTLTIHTNQIVHGVTLLKSGVRYGLFILKK